jgi:hypothetical protein
VSADPYDLTHEAALVGTSRARLADVDATAEQLLGPGDATPERRVLELAAVVGRLQRATARPLTTDREAGEPAPPPGREIRSAVPLVEQVLADGHQDDQVEALAWVAERDLRLDPDTTVRALEVATARTPLRTAARGAVGPRGRWLATHNEAWSWAAGAGAGDELDDAERRWDQGTLAERTALLRAARRQDPARGRALLTRTWDSDRADALGALIPELAVGLSRADEPDLESRLDDKRVQVRRAAAALLEQVAGSRLVERAVARAQARMHVTGRLRPTLEVDPPSAADEEMSRDAVAVERLHGMGEQASLLAHDLARVPPARLREVLGVDTDRLLRLVKGSDWQASLEWALARSAARWSDREVLVGLVGRAPLHGLVVGVSDEAAAAVLAATLRAGSGDGKAQGKRGIEALAAAPARWGPATARALWPAVLATIEHADARVWGAHEQLRAAGRSLPVTGDLPLDPSRYADDDARRAAESVLSTYTPRQRLHAALESDARHPQESP